MHPTSSRAPKRLWGGHFGTEEGKEGREEGRNMKITLKMSKSLVSKVSVLFGLLAQHFLCYFALYQYFSMTLGFDGKNRISVHLVSSPTPREPDLILDNCNDLSIKLLKP